MRFPDALPMWPVFKQLRGDDRGAMGEAARSATSERLRPRTDDADHVARSVCPFCAVGCGQLVHVRDGAVQHVEGDPDSPISRGRLCARGSSTKDLVAGPGRQYTVRYRPPGGRDWQDLDLDTAMDMIADRVIDAREESWQDTGPDGDLLNRAMGFGSLGGAALDNEENYLIKKLFTALGAIQVENQARI